MTARNVFVLVWAASVAFLFLIVEDWGKARPMLVMAVVSLAVVVYLSRRR